MSKRNILHIVLSSIIVLLNIYPIIYLCINKSSKILALFNFIALCVLWVIFYIYENKILESDNTKQENKKMMETAEIMRVYRVYALIETVIGVIFVLITLLFE